MEKTEELLKGDLTEEVVEQLMRVAYEDNSVRRWIREVAGKEKDKEKARILNILAKWFVPNHKEALKEAEREAKKGGAGQRYLYARLLLASDQPDEVLKVLKDSDKSLPFVLLEADARLRLGEVEKAEELIERAFGEVEKFDSGSRRWFKARLIYLKGYALEKEGLWEEAMKYYSKALDLAPNMHAAHFRLAYLLDLHGDDEGAIRHYEQAKRLRPLHVNTLVNLGVIYEDIGWYRRAMECYRAVLDIDPLHKRARMYLKDAEASLRMFYDERVETERRRVRKLLETPISEFELSVRSRNCLAKMNIRTLGDLVQKTENDLLSYKNFGETSLSEIRQVLASRGLRLGMKIEEIYQQGVNALSTSFYGTVDEEVLKVPVSKLQLSVRARRCLESLGIKTLGELVQRTEQELLEVRNFGQTSLSEIKEQLAKYGLTLKGSH